LQEIIVDVSCTHYATVCTFLKETRLKSTENRGAVCLRRKTFL